MKNKILFPYKDGNSYILDVIPFPFSIDHRVIYSFQSMDGYGFVLLSQEGQILTVSISNDLSNSEAQQKPIQTVLGKLEGLTKKSQVALTRYEVAPFLVEFFVQIENGKQEILLKLIRISESGIQNNPFKMDEELLIAHAAPFASSDQILFSSKVRSGYAFLALLEDGTVSHVSIQKPATSGVRSWFTNKKTIGKLEGNLAQSQVFFLGHTLHTRQFDFAIVGDGPEPRIVQLQAALHLPQLQADPGTQSSLIVGKRLIEKHSRAQKGNCNRFLK